MLEGVDKEKDVDYLKPTMKTLQSINELPINNTIAMAKADGEFTVLEYNRKGLTFTINRYGHWRTDFPALDDAIELLKFAGERIQSAQILCELFAVDENECPVILPKFIKAVKGKNQDLSKVRLGIWDLAKINGTPVTYDFDWRLQELHRIFNKGWRDSKACVLPYEQLSSFEEAQEFWELWVNKIGYEGIVARNNGTAYKLKPINSVDAVIIALNKVDSTGKPTKRWKEKKVSTVRVALLDRERNFVELGDCSIADPETQKALWQLNNFITCETPKRVYVKPMVVVEIKYTDVFEKSTNTYWKYKPTNYIRQGVIEFYKLRHPRFVRFRADKKVTFQDISVSQIEENSEPTTNVSREFSKGELTQWM